MNLNERCSLSRKGIFVLRAQLRADGKYHVAYQTPKGGWAIYDKTLPKGNRAFAEGKIQQLIASDPIKFILDPDLI